jgi:hypothetical protein
LFYFKHFLPVSHNRADLEDNAVAAGADAARNSFVNPSEFDAGLAVADAPNGGEGSVSHTSVVTASTVVAASQLFYCRFCDIEFALKVWFFNILSPSPTVKMATVFVPDHFLRNVGAA